MRVEPLDLIAPSPVAATTGERHRPVRTLLAVLVPAAIGLVHVAIIWPRYYVGSFDDDASFILSAKALLAGHAPFSEYPPGYSALIAPLVWLWPHSFAPLRLLSSLCYLAAFPLTWMVMTRRRLEYSVKVSALAMLALGPVFATYGSMVMAEAPFVVLFLLLLLALDRLESVSGTVGTILLAAALVWVKEAAFGLVVGLLLWMVVSGRWRRALIIGAGTGALLMPVIAVRVLDGIPLAGARYSLELGGYYNGGLRSRLVHVLPTGVGQLLGTAIPRTLVPYGSPLPSWTPLWDLLSYLAVILVGIGALVWLRRWRDATVPMAIVYLLETTLWPFVNERRSILILPLLIIWFLVGASAVIHFLAARRRRLAVAGSAVLAAAALVVPLTAQFGRDYLFADGQNSSHFGGSGYAQLLSHLGSSAQVVETDYRFSTTLFTGHATNWSAFIATPSGTCSPFLVDSAISDDHAAYLLLGDLNKPGLVDNMCLQELAPSSGWAIPLLNTNRDSATVYELVGPDTGNPSLTGLLSLPFTPGDTWALGSGALVSQVSIGSSSGPVALELRRPDGSWTVIASSSRAVGDEPGSPPYLLASFPQPVQATAVKVVVNGPALGGVADLAVIGLRPGPPTSS